MIGAISAINRTATFIAMIIALALSLALGASTVNQVQIMDSAGTARTSFSNTETITMKISCYVDTAVDKVNFGFYILNPSGAQVFSHTGNSMVGRIGYGGSQLANIPIASFYSTPGEYTFKGEAIPVLQNISGTAVSKTTKFTVYSANISLTYPPNGALDVIAEQLTFRWVASGATKYKVYIDNDASFYKPLWTQETALSEITYPQEPQDPLAKLKSSTVYWWKVEGLDSNGRVITTTPFPFNFTVKESAVVSSRDLSVTQISIAPGATKDSVKVNVHISNLGNQTEPNIGINLSIAGAGAISTQRITLIQPGETRIVQFDCGDCSKLKGKTITASASVNIFDDDPKNNILTVVLSIPEEEKAKILGGVTGKKEPHKPIADATVTYDGPVSGSVKTNQGGQYKIENLPLGEYELKATHPDCEDSTSRIVVIEKYKAHPNIDFELARKEEEKELAEEVVPARVYTLWDIWTILRETIEDKKLLSEFEGYNLVDIEIKPKCEIQELGGLLQKKKVKIIEYELEGE